MPKKSDNHDSEKERLKIEAVEYFMNDVFQNHLLTKNHLDTKINWLLGISALIMSLLLPYILKNDASVSHFGLFIIAFAAIVSFLTGLLSLELPHSFLKKKPEQETVMFNNCKRYKTSTEIYEELKRIRSYDDILHQYSIAVYNLVERNIKIKNKLFKFSSHVLLIGLVVGFIIIFLSLFL